ncbi:HepT-like ribonuclease domain-containing protein [Persephonella sp.]|uniref:DUF86 domain-containing protein n=1 Tax=Persephonella sp. TaxID=2060922 RepID=UPI0025E851F1|nr:HepT-like ribonuclease domain-containing protein [Persephonella sp.]
MLDIQFLNDKASKLVLFLKKADKILKNGEEQFLKIPMYPDRTQYYLISAYNELEEICCHLLKEVTGEKLKGGCVEKIVKEQLFSEKINRVLIDFSSYIKGVMESNYKYTPKEIYIIGSQITTTLLERFIKELSSVVKEIKAKEPKLSIPVNVKKLQDHAKAIKSSVRKISNFLNFPKEEFASTPLFIDRARYFSVVLIDSLLWICRHILRKSGKKVEKSCFQQLHKEGFIDKETAENLEILLKHRNIFADPTKEFDPEELYDLLKKTIPYSLSFLSQISKAIFKKD